MALTLITAPTALPVSLDEAKAWCRVTGSADDAVLGLLLGAACRAAEQLTGRLLGEQVWRLTLDRFSDAIELPRAPVLAIESFDYVDAAGDPQAVDGAAWYADLLGFPAWILRAEEESWPDPQSAANVVSITFSAGWDAASLPDEVRLAVLTTVSQWFDNREAGAALPDGAAVLLLPWRRVRI